MSIYPKIDFCECEFRQINANTTWTSDGFTPATDKKYAVNRFRANGAEPSAYVLLVWDWGGAAQKVIASTKGDVDSMFPIGTAANEFTGDNSKKFQLVIINDNDVQSPYIGGHYELVEVT